MQNYGMTKYQINKAYEKLRFNYDFMKNNGVHIDNKMVPFADFVVNSYMNSDRYVAELQHRAWSIYEYAEERGLKNIFITLTLPSEWHPKKTINKKLVNNPKFGGRSYICTINKVSFINAHVVQRVPFVEPELDFSQTIDKYTPRNGSKELSRSLKRLFDDRSFKNIDKDDRCYFRVTEPHKDGTPHLHISLFVPENKVESIVKALNRLFPAPLGKVETNVLSPVKYLMKYVLKTLDDLREEGSEISNLTLWYLYHGISRFYTSRTFVALEVYRKLNGMYTLRSLTDDYRSGDLAVYINPKTRDITGIENEYGVIYTPKPVNWYEKLNSEYTYFEGEFESVYKEKQHKQIDVYVDGEHFIYYNKELKKPMQSFVDMSSPELLHYFENKIDIDTVDINHYNYIQSLLIERGLLHADTQKLKDEILFESEVF